MRWFSWSTLAGVASIGLTIGLGAGQALASGNGFSSVTVVNRSSVPFSRVEVVGLVGNATRTLYQFGDVGPGSRQSTQRSPWVAADNVYVRACPDPTAKLTYSLHADTDPSGGPCCKRVVTCVVVELSCCGTEVHGRVGITFDRGPGAWVTMGRTKPCKVAGLVGGGLHKLLAAGDEANKEGQEPNAFKFVRLKNQSSRRTEKLKARNISPMTPEEHVIPTTNAPHAFVSSADSPGLEGELQGTMVDIVLCLGKVGEQYRTATTTVNSGGQLIEHIDLTVASTGDTVTGKVYLHGVSQPLDWASDQFTYANVDACP